MNISQLAVYQLPSDFHTSSKAETVPFYKRRRALNKRDFEVTPRHPSKDVQSLPLHKRIIANFFRNTATVGPVLPCPSASTPSAGLNLTKYVPHPEPLLPSQRIPASRPYPMKHMVATNKEPSVVRRATPDWSRVAYYTSAAPAQATGFSFLANRGDPQKSGTFD